MPSRGVSSCTSTSGSCVMVHKDRTHCWLYAPNHTKTVTFPILKDLATVVQRMDNAFHQLTHHLVDSKVCCQHFSIG